MAVIAPALLAQNQDDYKTQVGRLHEFTERVHIDLTDGEFAPTFTVSSAQVWWPQEWEVDIHAMVARPSDHLQSLIELKPNLVIFHAEVDEDIVPVLKQLQQADIKAGIALQRGTVPSSVKAAIETADHVMIFTGDLGKYGGTASMMQLEKIRLIKMIRADVEIGWDGGVTIDNAFSIVQGGVDVVNVGGTLAKSEDPKGTYDKLVEEIHKHGII